MLGASWEAASELDSHGEQKMGARGHHASSCDGRKGITQIAGKPASQQANLDRCSSSLSQLEVQPFPREPSHSQAAQLHSVLVGLVVRVSRVTAQVGPEKRFL